MRVVVYKARDGIRSVLVLPGMAAQLAPILVRYPATEDGRAKVRAELEAKLRQLGVEMGPVPAKTG